MYNLYKRGEVYWLRHHGKRISTGCKDKKAAEIWARNFERESLAPPDPAKNYLLRDALDDLIAAKRRAGRAKATIDVAIIRGRHLLRVWGVDATLSVVTAASVDAYCDTRLKEGAAKLTIDKELANLSSCLREAKRRGTWHGDVESVIPVWDADYRPRTRYLTQAQAWRLISALRPDRAAHVAFIFGTGCRKGESLRARRSDVDLERRLVFIRGTKTKHAAAEIPLTSLTLPFVSYALKHAPGEDLLFKQWDCIVRELYAACRRAGVPTVSPNDLRRSCATWYVQAGVRLDHVARILRHRDTTMLVKVYNQASAADLGALLETVFPLYRTDQKQPVQTGTSPAQNLEKKAEIEE